MSDLSNMSDADLMALHTQSQASPLAHLSDEELTKLHAKSQPDQTAWYERAIQGGKDTANAIGQLGAHAPDWLNGPRRAVTQGDKTVFLSPEETTAQRDTERKAFDTKIADEERAYQTKRGESGGTFDPARLGGNIASTLPAAMMVPGAAATSIPRMVASGMGQGAVTGALQPIENGGQTFAADKAKQVGLGALAGGGASGTMGAASRVLSPATRPEVTELMARGVTPTPGQVLGGNTGRLENLAAKVPFVGDIVRSGQQRAGEEYNIAAVNEALSQIGKSVPSDIKAGNAAVAYGRETIGHAYDEILPKITAQSDQKFETELTSYIDASKEFPKARFDQFVNSVETQFKKVPPSGEIRGPLLQELKSHFSRLGSNYVHSSDADQRLLGGMYNNVADSLKSLAARSSPEAQEALSAVDAAHARMMRVELAAGKNMESGVFSPSQLLQAVKSQDQTIRDKASSQGKALMQPFGQAGSRVLGPSLTKPANSAGAGAGVAGLGALGLAHPAGAVAGLGAAAAYTPMGQRAMASLLTQRPAIAAPMAQAAQGAAPIAATGAASYIANESPRERLARMLATSQRGM